MQNIPKEMTFMNIKPKKISDAQDFTAGIKDRIYCHHQSICKSHKPTSLSQKCFQNEFLNLKIIRLKWIPIKGMAYKFPMSHIMNGLKLVDLISSDEWCIQMLPTIKRNAEYRAVRLSDKAKET